MDKGEEKEKTKKRRRSKVWMLWILYGFMILYGKIKP